jgi:hypothetical protein
LVDLDDDGTVDDVEVDRPCSSELFGLLRTFFDFDKPRKSARVHYYSNSEVMVCPSAISSSNITPSILHISRGLVCLRSRIHVPPVVVPLSST